MNRKQYRKEKLEWFIKNQEIYQKSLENSQKSLEQHKKEWSLYKDRSLLEMELVRLRIIREQMMYAIDKMRADEKDREEEDE